MYLPDPAEVLRQLAGLVRPGGIVAFHEYQVKFRPPSVPGPVALWEQFLAWMVSAFERVGVETEMGLKLHSAFTAAGLPRPQTRMDVHLMGPDDPLGPRVGAHSLRSLLPVMERFGLARAEEVGIETFAERLHAALVADGAMTCWPPLVGAWTRVP